jgi:hypothetical protein
VFFIGITDFLKIRKSVQSQNDQALVGRRRFDFPPSALKNQPVDFASSFIVHPPSSIPP